MYMKICEFICQLKECFLLLVKCLIHQATPRRGTDPIDLTTIKPNKRLNLCPMGKEWEVPNWTSNFFLQLYCEIIDIHWTTRLKCAT